MLQIVFRVLFIRLWMFVYILVIVLMFSHMLIFIRFGVNCYLCFLLIALQNLMLSATLYYIDYFSNYEASR